MSDQYLLITILAIATFSMRYFGVLLGQYIPDTGAWARALNALPGCLIVSLVAVMVMSGGPTEWLGAVVALGVAITTRNLPLTMLIGVVAVWILRSMV